MLGRVAKILVITLLSHQCVVMDSQLCCETRAQGLMKYEI